MKNLFKKPKIILLLILIAVNISSVFLSSPTRTTDQQKTNVAFFEIKPDVTFSDYDKARILGSQYPAVNTPPTSLTYFIVHFAENYKLLTNQASPSFLASKRIAELQTWGNLIRIEGNVKNLKELGYGWNPYNIMSFESFNHLDFDSWEVSLKRYLLLMESELVRLKQNPASKKNGLIIENALKNHQDSVEATIMQSVYSDEEKNYLLNLSTQIFIHLRSLLATSYQVAYNPTKPTYLVPPLTSSGMYDVIYLENKPASYQKPFTLLHGGRSFALVTHELTPDGTRRMSSVWPGVSLGETSSELVIDTTMDRVSLLPDKMADWQYSMIESKAKHSYATNFEIPTNEENYVLIFSSSLPSDVRVEVAQLYEHIKLNAKKKNISTERSLVILKENIPKSDGATVIYRPLKFKKGKIYTGARLTIFSETKLDEEKLSNIEASLAIVFEPTLFLENKNKLPAVLSKPPSKPQASFYISLLSIFSIIVAFLMLVPTKLWKALSARVLQILRPMRSVIMISVLVAVMNDIFIFKAIHNNAILALILLWIIANHNQTHRTSINLLLALTSAVLAIFLFVFGITLSSEKALIWMSIFFITGLVSELAYGTPLREPRLDLITHILEQTLKTALHQFRSIFKKQVLSLLGIQIISGSYRFSLVRFFFGMFISGIIILTCIHTARVLTNIMTDIQTNRLTESRKPVIDTFEPRIVYHGSKVIITGKRFGWLKEGERSLRSSRGTIRVDFWGDTKIVFTLPLDWKLGKTQIWVEKFEIIRGKKTLAKSNIATFDLISRLGSWDKEDDAYFDQLKDLSEEVLEINGYSPSN